MIKRLQSNRGVAVLTMAAQQFSGQVAIITGGAQGLGRAIAETLLRDGASVMLFDLDRAQVEKTCADLKKIGSGKVECLQVVVASSINVYTHKHAQLYPFPNEVELPYSLVYSVHRWNK